MSVRRLVFLSTALGAFIVTANVSTMNVAFPDLEATFSGNARSSITWVLNAYTICFASLLAPSGRLADRFGRRQLYVSGLVVFAVASIAVGAAPTLAWMIAARVLQGVGGALVVPASLGLLLAVTPATERTGTVAKWGSATALGIAAGPSIGAVVVEYGGWRFAFLIIPPFAALAYLAGRRALPDTPVDPDAALPDLAGAVILASAMAAIALGLVQTRAWGLVSPGVLASLVAGVALLALLVSRSHRHPHPILPLELFGLRTFTTANTATLVQSGALSSTLLVNILWLTGGWNYSILAAGLATVPSPLIVAALAPLAGRLGGSGDIRRIVVPGSLVWAAGIAWYVIKVGEQADYWRAWFPATVLVGVGIAMTFPLVSAVAVSEVPPSSYALAGGVNQVARQFGATVGVAGLIAVLGSDPDLAAFDRAWLVVAFAGVVSALLTLTIRQRRTVAVPAR